MKPLPYDTRTGVAPDGALWTPLWVSPLLACMGALRAREHQRAVRFAWLLPDDVLPGVTVLYGEPVERTAAASGAGRVEPGLVVRLAP